MKRWDDFVEYLVGVRASHFVDLNDVVSSVAGGTCRYHDFII